MRKPQAWMIALQGLSFDDAAGTCRVVKTIGIACRSSDDEERQLLYKTLLELKWLPSRIRSAILKELSSSLRTVQRDYAGGRAEALRCMIDEAKARMRKQRMRKKGGIHDAAVAEIAEHCGITPETLKKQLQRHAPR
jgi:hypothetical protein